MAIGKIIGVGSILLFVAGCQSWRYQDVDSLPPSAALPQTSQPGVVQVSYWNDVAGAEITSLTALNSFPTQPDEIVMLESLQSPADRGSNYGSLVRGYIIPPSNGQYRFFVSGDDQTHFRLNTAGTSATGELLAAVPRWTYPGEYGKYPEQTSSYVQLEAGRRYYFEIIHKESGGSDHFTVAWEGPGFSRQIVQSNALASLGQSLYPDSEELNTVYSLGYRVGYMDGSEDLSFKPNYPPLDKDQDGLYDNWEVFHGLSPTDPSDAGNDPDGDLLSAADEFLIGTSENDPDTDNDGLPDGFEFAYNLNPRDPDDALIDSDGDGYTNLREYSAGTAIDNPDDTPLAEPTLVAGFGGQYFLGRSFNDFQLIRQDGAINFSWGSATAPATGLPTDQYSVRWVGVFNPPHSDGSRQYRFTTTTDDGVRLYLDGQLIIDRWRDQGPTSYSHTADLAAGQGLPLVMEYYENGGGAVARLSITDVTTGETLAQPDVVSFMDPADTSAQDTDADGIPDTWEIRQGLNPFEDSASAVVNDQGVTNLQAFRNNLNPWTLEDLADPAPPSNGLEAVSPAANTATLSWTAPFTRQDGSSLSLAEIDHYIIRYGQNEAQLEQRVEVSGDATSYQFDNLASGTWYFTIQVVDDQGLISAPSAVVSKTIQ